MKIIESPDSKNLMRLQTATTARSESRTSEIVIEIAFCGDELFHVENRRLTLFPYDFLLIPREVSYTRIIDALIPVTSFSLQYGSRFVNDFQRNLHTRQQDLLDSPFEDEVFYDDAFNSTDTPLALYPFRNDFRYSVLNLRRSVENGESEALLIDEYFYHILFNYYRIYQSEVISKIGRLKFSKSTRDELMRRLIMAKDFMRSNCQHKVTLDEISKAACLSVNHLLRTFHQAFNTSPYQFLCALRMERADYYLKHFDYPIAEIATISGFDEPSSFIRAYRVANGTSPGKLRKNLRRCTERGPLTKAMPAKN